MTQRDFQNIAYALMESRPHTEDNDVRMQWESDVNAMADVCMKSNSRFNRDLFMRAVNAPKYDPAMHGQ